MHDLLVNLLASIVAGTAVWVGQRLLRYQRLARKRAFLGLDGTGECLLAGGPSWSPRARSSTSW